MFSSRRLPKRSIIGTRICSTWQDGRFYPGIIQSTQTGPNGDDLFIIRFDDGFTKLALERDIIGPGFQNIITAKLKHAQKVFVTHNGREVSGVVLSHDDVTDEVLISIMFNDGSEMEVTRRLEDVRLLESRKSARLQDQDTDYSRLADIHPEPKKRTVSQIIEVPQQHTKPSRRRKNSPDVEESMAMECEVKEDEDEDEMDNQMDTMDEHMAAMVLTSLSCSPQSPQFPGSFTDRPHFPGFIDKGATSPGPSAPGSSVGSSGVFTVKSEPGTPSPPRVIAHSAPNAPLFGTPPIDEGIELDDTSDYFADDIAPKKRRSTTTMFKCTWRDCGKVYNSTLAIESHVRHEHLGPKDESDSDLSDSDHEEEFYYIEVEVTVDNVIETFADMRTTSSPPQSQNDAVRCIQDHDYQKKEPRSAPQNIPTLRRGDHQIAHSASTLPSQTAGVGPLSRSWQATTTQVSPPARLTMPTSRPMKVHHLASSPKSSPMHKKSRSEVKKCRKVYGMENRDMWCTQCKWKKACSRFHE